ncbi:MAG TPA: hypothetical protein PKC18_05405 [Lacipirellulaceae bacterium]|nr:hypothetical protein [Lacipirellulaceae bacterium]
MPFETYPHGRRVIRVDYQLPLETLVRRYRIKPVGYQGRPADFPPSLAPSDQPAARLPFTFIRTISATPLSAVEREVSALPGGLRLATLWETVFAFAAGVRYGWRFVVPVLVIGSMTDPAGDGLHRLPRIEKIRRVIEIGVYHVRPDKVAEHFIVPCVASDPSAIDA